MALTTVFST